MRRWIAAVALSIGWATGALAAETAPLSTLAAVHSLDNAQAIKRLPADFEATVIFYRGYEYTRFRTAEASGKKANGPAAAAVGARV